MRVSLTRTTFVVVRTILISAVGGLVFALLDLPAPWIAGGMLAVAGASLSGVAVFIPAPVREVVFFLLGVSIGSAMTPESIAGIAVWPLSLVLLCLAVPVVTLGAGIVLIRWRGWPRDDALLATAPGALGLVIAIADSINADVPRIAVVQTLRLAILVIVLPPLISAFNGVAPVAAQPPVTLAELDLPQLALLVAASVVGAFLARLAKLPTPGLLGAMLASAVLYGSGAVTASIPDAILLPGLVVLGAFVGARFRGMTLRDFRAGLADALLVFAVAFALSAALAGLVTALLGLPFGQTILAFAPGGFEVMTVMAFALGFDAAYVGLHHTVRFFAISFSAPFVFRRRKNGGS